MRKELVFIFGLLVLFSTGFVLAANETNVTNQAGELIACPEDAKICEDGSVLERDSALGCEFPACPEELILDCANEGALCGGIAGIACCSGFSCELEGNFTDASGTCVAEPEIICVDSCGDGVCNEVVCQGEGCPCAESVGSCEVDCSVAEESEEGFSLFWLFVVIFVAVALVIVGIKIAKWLVWAAIIAFVIFILVYLFIL